MHCFRGAVYQLRFQNETAQPLDGFMIQFNKNTFGLAPANQVVPVGVVGPRSSGTASVPLVQNPAMVSPAQASPALQVPSRPHPPLRLWYIACLVHTKVAAALKFERNLCCACLCPRFCCSSNTDKALPLQLALVCHPPCSHEPT